MPARVKEQVKHTILGTYPGWVWEVLEAAKKGEGYCRTFPAKNYAVNAMHRYHKFRQDAIALNLPGASLLADMPCSFAKDIAEPTLLWVFLGDVAKAIEEEARSAVLGQHQPQPGVIKRTLGDSSQSEQEVEKWLGAGKAREAAPRADASSVDVPALDLSSRGEEIPPCPPHELDDLSDACIKCKLPRSAWAK
jgi:hypothetical protein